MKNRKSFNQLCRNPIVIGIIAFIMITMILAFVVFSAKMEALLKANQKPELDPQARPPDQPEETVISPPSNEAVIISEDGNQPTKIRSSGTYLNKLLAVSTGYGMTFSLGIDQQDASDAIYLNPHFEYAYAGNPEEAYGYLIRTERVPLEYSETSEAPAWSEKHRGLTDFAIVGRTYDKVVSASVQSRDHFGVRWIDSPAYGGLEHGGDTARILIIRISDGTLMGAVKAEISYDYGTHSYGISNLVNSDVSYTGELTGEQRGELVEETIRILVQGNTQMTLGISREELEAQSASVVVDHPQRTYYSKLYDMDGNIVSSGRYSNCEIYAVNINCDGYGFFTVYFAPEPQANGLTVQTLNEGEPLKLVPIGYDAIAPFTVDSFNRFLLPEDMKHFGTD